MDKTYMCIDLKSFYASVECRERNLDPLDTNLVVADEERTDKTICLAVSPSLKSYGISGRARLFEAKQKVREVNYQRKKDNHYKPFIGKSYINSELIKDNSLELDFIKAVPRMKLYMKYSTNIYNIYLKYIAPEDILVYSIDEVFCDITNYLKFYKMTAEDIRRQVEIEGKLRAREKATNAKIEEVLKRLESKKALNQYDQKTLSKIKSSKLGTKLSNLFSSLKNKLKKHATEAYINISDEDIDTICYELMATESFFLLDEDDYDEICYEVIATESFHEA